MTSSKEPLRHSLAAAAKKKVAPKLKNVLAQPFPRYWPEINETDCETIKQQISKALVEHSKNNPHAIGVNLGTASCLRLLKRREASCFLISTEVKPKFIVSQIIHSVISKNDGITILCVPNLKKITEDIFKIPSLILAVLKGKQPIIEEWIKEKSKSFPIPEKLLAYYGTVESPKEQSQHPESTENPYKKKKLEDKVNFNDLYLTRSSPDYREFIPDNAKELMPLANDKVVWSDYISFSDKAAPVVKMEVDNSDTNFVDNKTNRAPLPLKFGKAETYNKNPRVKKELGASALTDLKRFNLSNKQKFRNNKKEIKMKGDHNTNNPVFKYISLQVNKIQGNPDKKRKKKNKKK